MAPVPPFHFPLLPQSWYIGASSCPLRLASFQAKLTPFLATGHMRRAMREITELVQSHKLDLIIETRDARLPLTSINPAFERLLAEQAGRGIGAPTSAAGGGKGFGTTKRLIVYNKADLAQDCFQIVSLAGWIRLHSPAKHSHCTDTLAQPLQRALAQHDEDQVLFTDSRSDHEVKRVLEAAISTLRIPLRAFSKHVR